MAKKAFREVLTAAVADIVDHGYDSAERVATWVDLLRQAAEAAMTSRRQMEDMLRDALIGTYRRQIEHGGLLKRHEGVGLYTLQNIRPALRAELDRRILASADLIRLNRERAVAETLQRFQGWATSIPKGGTDAASKPKVKREVRKAMVSLPFRERRVLIDQGAKLNSSLSDIVAKDGGAIAGVWQSHFQRAGYDYRENHRLRHNKVYLIRGSWAHENGLVKPGLVGYTDEITQPAEEVFCQCFYRYLYSLGRMPREMLTAKGAAALEAVRKNEAA